jgi:hypothetical protein
MPKDVIDYSNTIIYKIFCNDVLISDIYVGHTTNFVKRKYQHKVLCNSSNKLKIYDVIRKNGGWDNWSMIEIAKYNCQDATEARIREHEYCDLLKPSLNLINPVSNNKYNVLQFDNSIKNKDDLNDIIKTPKYYCQKCDYGTSKKSSYDDHLLSRKHMMSTDGNKNLPKICSEHICDECGKIYKDRSGLWRHLQKHKNYDNNKNLKTDEDSDDISTKELILMIFKQNTELQQALIEAAKQNSITNNNNNTTNTNSHNQTNNSFNLQFFLNETCKNAMNMTDFIESIKLQLSDLISVGEIGYIEGISNIIVKNLNALDVTERPVHCTDKKRETFYIKDENKWEKDEDDKKKMRKVIKNIAYKNEKLLPEFKKKYPDYNDSDSIYSDQYSKIIVESYGVVGDNTMEKEDKIIRNISKAITIDKYSKTS